MNLLDYTIQSGFLPHLECESLSEAVNLLVAPLVEAGDVADAGEVVGEVLRREAEGSTAVGGGLVIPHARSGRVQRARIAVATLATPLAIPTTDELPVDLVILLVGPSGDPRQMLRVLARLARLVRRRSFLDGLRNCETPNELRQAFTLADPAVS